MIFNFLLHLLLGTAGMLATYSLKFCLMREVFILHSQIVILLTRISTLAYLSACLSVCLLSALSLQQLSYKVHLPTSTAPEQTLLWSATFAL